MDLYSTRGTHCTTSSPGLPTVMKSVSVGTTLSGNVCGIDSADNLWCWGDNTFGQLGHTPGTAGDQAGTPCLGAYCNSKPSKVTLDPDAGTTLGNVADVRAGLATCVVRSDGTVWCWGNDQTGELGQGTHDKKVHETPTQIASFGTDGARIVGGDAFCLLGKTGAVSCWGEANWDVPGVGQNIGCNAFAGNPSPCVPAPAAIGSLVAAGLDTSQARHAVALLVDGGLVGWGASAGGANGHDPGQDGDIDAGGLWLNPTPSPIPIPF